MLANEARVITRKGAEHEQDSVINLAWYNEIAVQTTSFSDLKIDWGGSLGSDHAMLIITGHTQDKVIAPDDKGSLGFLIDPEKSEEWTRAFKARSSHSFFQHTPSPDEIEIAAASFMEDIQQTNEEVLRKQHPAHPKLPPGGTRHA